MTRKQQILIAAYDYSHKYVGGEEPCIDFFKKGVEWCERHPLGPLRSFKEEEPPEMERVYAVLATGTIIDVVRQGNKYYHDMDKVVKDYLLYWFPKEVLQK